jgi:hypothetical protein
MYPNFDCNLQWRGRGKRDGLQLPWHWLQLPWQLLRWLLAFKKYMKMIQHFDA